MMRCFAHRLGLKGRLTVHLGVFCCCSVVAGEEHEELQWLVRRRVQADDQGDQPGRQLQHFLDLRRGRWRRRDAGTGPCQPMLLDCRPTPFDCQPTPFFTGIAAQPSRSETTLRSSSRSSTRTSVKTAASRTSTGRRGRMTTCCSRHIARSAGPPSPPRTLTVSPAKPHTPPAERMIFLAFSGLMGGSWVVFVCLE